MWQKLIDCDLVNGEKYNEENKSFAIKICENDFDYLETNYTKLLTTDKNMIF